MPRYTPEALAFRSAQKAKYRNLAIEYLKKNGSGTRREIYRYVQSKVDAPQSQILYHCLGGSTSHKFTRDFMRFDRKTQRFYLLEDAR